MTCLSNPANPSQLDIPVEGLAWQGLYAATFTTTAPSRAYWSSLVRPRRRLTKPHSRTYR